MDNLPSDQIDVEHLARSLAATRHEIARKVTIRTATAAELRRQFAASSRRRGGPGSADARKYGLGSTLVMLGADGIDDSALLGLLAHPGHMARWIGAAERRHSGKQLGDLIRIVFADQARFAWCKQWGAILQWRYRKPIYDAAVQRFLDSGRTGPRERWRREEITDDQASLILTLTGILAEPAPDLADRGEAFDWIAARGGNPTYWREPLLPPELEDHNA